MRMRGNWTPSLAPTGHDQTVYIVLNDFGPLGRAYCEASEDRSDLETEVDLLPAQIDQLAHLRSRAKRGVSKGKARE